MSGISPFSPLSISILIAPLVNLKGVLAEIAACCCLSLAGLEPTLLGNAGLGVRGFACRTSAPPAPLQKPRSLASGGDSVPHGMCFAHRTGLRHPHNSTHSDTGTAASPTRPGYFPGPGLPQFHQERKGSRARAFWVLPDGAVSGSCSSFGCVLGRVTLQNPFCEAVLYFILTCSCLVIK